MQSSWGQVMTGSAGTWSAKNNWFNCGLELRFGKQVQAETLSGTAAGWRLVKKRLGFD